VILLVALSESLALVGLLVPGAAILFAAGALIASGALQFWPMCLWAMAGAIIGDSVSYWLGRHYRDHVRDLWPFYKHPGLLRRGEVFLERHGGKSILLGRFVGPMRPVIPIVAGMLDMPPSRFYTVNVLSAIGWAPAYLLPGMAFGASLALAGAVSGRLALLVGLLVALGWLLVLAGRYTAEFLGPLAQRWGEALAHWARTHGRLSWLLGDLLEPSRKPSRALAAWVFLLIGGTWLFFGVLEDVLTLDPLVQTDHAVYNLLQSLRGPLGDRLMVTLSELGDATVLLAVIGVVVAWLIRRRAWRDLGYVVAAVTFGRLVVATLKVTLQVPRPVPLYSGIEAYSFPSSHATMSMVVYGILAVLCSEELSRRWRPLPLGLAAMLITGISLSRLYLGAHWLSDVVAGLALGSTWVALVAIARHRHIHQILGPMFAPAMAMVVVLVGAWHVERHLGPDLTRYAAREPVGTLTAATWEEDGWRTLPSHRLDLEGRNEQPLNVQWAGSLDGIRSALVSKGWHQPVPLSLRTALHWLAPDPALATLPLLPQLHDGRHDALAMVFDPRSAAAGGSAPSSASGESAPNSASGESTPTAASGGPGDRLLVLRLWSANVELAPGDQPVWLGTLAWLRLERLPLLRFPATAGDYDRAIAAARSEAGMPASCSERDRIRAGDRRIALLCRNP